MNDGLTLSRVTGSSSGVPQFSRSGAIAKQGNEILIVIEIGLKGNSRNGHRDKFSRSVGIEW